MNNIFCSPVPVVVFHVGAPTRGIVGSVLFLNCQEGEQKNTALWLTSVVEKLDQIQVPEGNSEEVFSSLSLLTILVERSYVGCPL
jgi:hypothetical protein